MEIAKDTHDRIFAAANSLYDQGGRAGFPTVDAVRKTARVNMNDASTGMKQWRHAQMTQAAPVANPVPEGVRQANALALAALWWEAQDLATESLRAAQNGWDAERAEADTLNRQMADAYEAQAAELEAAQAVIVQLKIAAGLAAADNARLEGALNDTCRELTSARSAAERLEAKTIEIERRASELRTELDHAHQESVQIRTELAGERQDHSTEVLALRIKGERERDKAQIQASQAREEAATLRGQVDAMKEQNAALFWAIPKPGATDQALDTR